jgi:excinuclease ABC subunit C
MDGVDVIRKSLETMPGTPGVYRMLDAQGGVLYIGKAKNLQKRVQNYLNIAQLTLRMQRAVVQTATLEILHARTEAEALLLEASLIKSLKPRYNILLRDDKTMPSLLLRGDHPFPALSKYRGAKVAPPHQLFGPFASVSDVEQTITMLQKMFLLRPCSDTYFASRKRPCLQYQIQRCSAPCVGKISAEAYQNNVAHAVEFLSGKSAGVKAKLIAEMEACSQAMEYEKAAQLRDRIALLTQRLSQQHYWDHELRDADVIAVVQEYGISAVSVLLFRSGQHFGNRSYFPAHAENASVEEVLSAFIGQFYQRHEVPPLILLNHTLAEAPELSEALALLAKRKVQLKQPKRGALQEIIASAERNAASSLAQRVRLIRDGSAHLKQLATLLGMQEDKEIHRLEIYDNSHISGTRAVGVMVVAGVQGFETAAYRSYTMPETLGGGDDYAMLRLMLARRLKRLVTETPVYQEEIWPDILIIDGGLGQLHAAQEVLATFELQDKIAVMAIAKGPNRDAGMEKLYLADGQVVSLPKNEALLYYLQRLRDEAHRFAITSHRQKRQKALTASGLSVIPGVGEKRRKLLMQHFGSLQLVAEASVEELASVQDIGPRVAQTIYNYLHGEK